MATESTEVICPECGKQIVPAGTIDEASRCRCEERMRNRRAMPPPEQVKTCYVCGTNLQGRKRMKDAVGRYWCVECAQADERARRREKENTCPDCSRVIPPDLLFEYGDTKLCRPCYKKRIDEAHKKLIRMSVGANAKKKELDKIKWLSIILAILLGLALLTRVFG